MVFKLAHISDVHLGPLPKVRLRELLSKRVTGYANWQRNRARHMGGNALKQLMEMLAETDIDHLAITGDLVNLALELEIENVGLWLEAAGPGEEITVVPGNHDAYVRGALKKALRRWQPYVIGDDNKPVLENKNFPTLRKRGPVALIGTNSAIATLPFMASGKIGSSQAKRLEKMLIKAGDEGLFRVVLIHHPPWRGATIPSKRLYGIGRFQKLIKRAGAELILHGHTHLPQRHHIEGKDGKRVPVIGVPSASAGPGGKKPAAAFNLFEIEKRDDGGWHCRLTERSVTAQTSLPQRAMQEILDDVS